MRPYPPGELYEEMSYIAYHFHWGHDEIMTMDHLERRRWVEEIARVNTQLNETGLESA